MPALEATAAGLVHDLCDIAQAHPILTLVVIFIVLIKVISDL